MSHNITLYSELEHLDGCEEPNDECSLHPTIFENNELQIYISIFYICDKIVTAGTAPVN